MKPATAIYLDAAICLDPRVEQTNARVRRG
jgi:hypothetical protein